MKPASPPEPLVRDGELSFPRFLLLRASAGAGKTHALSLWYLQMLLSEAVRRKTPNDLRNILAITFTRNAVREMKTRILSWLKELSFGDEKKTKQILDLVTLDSPTLSSRAASLLEDILARYSDFQVETIDSFMTSVFKASALDLGIPPHFEVVLDNSSLLEYAFSRFLRKVTPRSAEGETFLRISELISASQKPDDAFAWDPTSLILDRLSSLHARLNAQTKPPHMADLEKERRDLENKASACALRLRRSIDRSGAEPNLRSSFHSRLDEALHERKFNVLLDASFKTLPVKKSKNSAVSRAVHRVEIIWREMERLAMRYRALHARRAFQPYLMALKSFASTLEEVKRRREAVFIEDIPQRLSSYIQAGIVPDIYFRLGERVFHFLIDEFQDTSPIQWANLRPLIENSLALNGSLLVVGDTKQAIYGFREADYRIMTDLEAGHEGFPSVATTQRFLGTNFRSQEEILDFVKHLFRERLARDENLIRVGDKSGLTQFEQEVKPQNKSRGYVTVTLVDKKSASRDGEDEDPENGGDATDHPQEEVVLLGKVRDLRSRGFAFSDIAVLTFKNESVVRVSSWLNEADPPIPFIPFSSLDIRTRPITREVLALLAFLDSPPDDLALAEFLLGDAFHRKLEDDGRASGRDSWHAFLFEARRLKGRPLYIVFRERYPELWKAYFDRLFRLVGYSPLYDLAALVYGMFELFRLFPEEEATLVKLLESIKDFEAAGKNDLGEFLELTAMRDRADPAWNIEVPLNIDAVRVMSIHKAKGLQFPAVILLQYGQRFIPPEFYLDTRGENLQVLKLTGPLAEADSRLGEVYEEEKGRNFIDRCNSLYVGLTRAEAELHVIGVRSGGRKPVFPFNLLDDGLKRSWGRPAPAEPKPAIRGEEGLTLRFRTDGEAPPATRAELSFEKIRRGLVFHELLSRVEFLEVGWESRLAEMIRDQRSGAADFAGETEGILSEFFARSPLRAYFERRPERRVLTEFNVCDSLGRMHRLDRLIVDPEGVTVLDYKTGDLPDPEARQRWDEDGRAQMRLYLKIVAELFPGRPVRGILAYLDRGTWEELE